MAPAGVCRAGAAGGEDNRRKRFWHRNIDEGQMKDINSQSDQHAATDDVATLYSWANLHGAKYRDFSAARAQTREKARLRAEQASEEEQRHRTGEPEAEHGAEAGQAAED